MEKKKIKIKKKNIIIHYFKYYKVIKSNLYN